MALSFVNLEEDKMKEECGVFGVFSNNELPVSQMTYYGLYGLQHRGQESAGIAVSNGEDIKCYKEMGLVTEVFDENTLESLEGNIAIGHVRYSTSGDSLKCNAQPLITHGKLGTMAIAHNGNLTNADTLKDLLQDGGFMFQSTTDSEVILGLIARYAKEGIEKAIFNAMQVIKGSFAIVILTKDKLVGVRDTNGIRPLCIGRIKNSYVLSSESCALDAVGGEFVRDVMPGEIVVIDKDGVRSINPSERTSVGTCSFEYIYFARPDSIIDGINVYDARVRTGEILYKECPADADIVIGVPDSGIPAAVGYAKAAGIPYETGFVKNKYVGRSFIAPTQELREMAVSLKLNPLKSVVSGKRVVLIDDSIVRGTTSKKLVASLKKAGAKEVHFRVASPIVKYPCYFGIDIQYRKELIGANYNIDEIAEKIGADTLGYISLEGLLKAFNKEGGFCLGCFNGEYPVAPPMEASIEK